MPRLNYIYIVLISITLYGFLGSALGVASASGLKIVITLLLWVAVVSLIVNYLKNRVKLSFVFDAIGLHLVSLLLVINFVIIMRGFIDVKSSLNTAFGNPFNALAFFSPLAFFLAGKKNSLHVLNKFIYAILIAGLCLIFPQFFIYGINVARESSSFAWGLIYPAIFLIGSVDSLNRFQRYTVLASTALIFWYSGIVLGSRATLVRISLLYVFRYLTRISYKLPVKVIYPLLVCGLILFTYQTISTSVYSEESFFQKTLTQLQHLAGSSSKDSILEKADTRTFLYYEVINDLIKTKSLFFGKGGSGTYFSNYFYVTGDDTDNRLTVEVGFLTYLLKGGVLAAALNIIIFLYASYFGIYKSHNKYLRWIGFVLLVHVFILFVENLVSFDFYNICIWIFVGACLSKKFLQMNDTEMMLLLRAKKTVIKKDGSLYA